MDTTHIHYFPHKHHKKLCLNYHLNPLSTLCPELGFFLGLDGKINNAFYAHEHIWFKFKKKKNKAQLIQILNMHSNKFLHEFKILRDSSVKMRIINAEGTFGR